jgi:type IV pilus assembly protein PilX
MKSPRIPRRSRESGLVLIVSLVMMLMMLIIGMAGMNETVLQERMAGNMKDRNHAFQAAEAALRDGEAELQRATLPNFNGTDKAGFIQPVDEPGKAETWNTYTWATSNSQGYSGLTGLYADPRYVIEELPAVLSPDESASFGAVPEASHYRVTAKAWGGTADAIVFLQTTYKR